MYNYLLNIHSTYLQNLFDTIIKSLCLNCYIYHIVLTVISLIRKVIYNSVTYIYIDLKRLNGSAYGSYVAQLRHTFKQPFKSPSKFSWKGLQPNEPSEPCESKVM
ncbi:Hypothetical_protein [Hexamita inflata]|uniref:Hypothetical_protein n=1 Tax=Hexamita inflata TaxID=28002 RepID=A0AA86NR62_9EUKA|nr:Hypothetical protein HINF_LOCUS11454 [Hexamita inflata]